MFTPGRFVVSAAVGIALLGLAGCGSSSDTAGSPGTASAITAPSDATSAAAAPSETPTSADDGNAELKAAVQAYSDAFLTGKAAAYDMLSKRCQERMDRNEFIGMLAAAKSEYGSALPMKTFKADISGDMARVTYTYDIAAINQDSEPWVRESGSWKEDDC